MIADQSIKKGGMEPGLCDEMRVRAITPRALFFAFLKVSLYGFGGPIVWARRVLIEERRWLSDSDFADILSFCQFLPGPNVVSVTVCIGAKFHGAAGALAALAGFILFPWTLGFAMGIVILSYAQTALLQGILRGVAAAAAGMIIATGIRLLRPHRQRPLALAVTALAFAGLAAVRLPLLIVVVGLVPVSIAMAGRERTAAQ
jgi:chromate transporter